MNCKGFLFLFLITSSVTFGQTKIGGDLNEINSGSLLELEDSARGLLLPRILLDNIDQWSLLGTPVDGMVIASEGGTVPDGIYHWNDGAWHILSGDFTETVTSAGQLTVTYNHVSQANTFGAIRGIKISKNTWKPNGRNERIGLNTAVLEGAVLTSGPSVNETLWGPRMISVPYAERNTYLFIPRDSRGGVAIIKAAGWQQEHWYGILTWRDAGGGGA